MAAPGGAGGAAGAAEAHARAAAAVLQNQWRGFKSHAAQLGEKVQATQAYQKTAGYVDDKMDDLRAMVTLMVEKKVDASLDKVGDIIKRNATDDPDMFKWAKHGIEKIIDGVYPEIKMEAASVIMSGFREEVKPPAGPQHFECCPNPFRCIRGFILYHLYPYDKSIWKQLRDFWYWFFTIVSMFPLYGVTQAFYLVLFLLKDKEDEFQLTNFIIGFKGIQFVTLGALSAIIGGLQYYMCVSVYEKDDLPTCDVNGPSVAYWEIIYFVLQVVLVWIAFLYLPYSKKKGGKVYRVHGKKERDYDLDGDGMLSIDELMAMQTVIEEEKEKARKAKEAKERGEKDPESLQQMEQEEDPYDKLEKESKTPPGRFSRCCCGGNKFISGRGGVLQNWLIYDLVCFLLMAGCAVWAMFSGNSSIQESADDTGTGDGWSENWRLKATLFWVRVGYGLLSVPFALFKIPVLGALLTHARPTAYNRAGETVPVLTAGERSRLREQKANKGKTKPSQANANSAGHGSGVAPAPAPFASPAAPSQPVVAPPPAHRPAAQGYAPAAGSTANYAGATY